VKTWENFFGLKSFAKVEEVGRFGSSRGIRFSLGFKEPQKLNGFQKLSHKSLKAKSRLILLNLFDDLLLYGAQRLLLSKSVDEFDVEVALCINVSED
jgi:hypothetical protein